MVVEPVAAVVRGPATLSVADAEAHEGADEAVEFRVTLGRAASGTVTVDYATGCRRGEIVALHWSEIQADGLVLADSKSGPRTVWLSRPARDILDRIERTGAWVFPSPRAAQPRCTD